MFTGDHLHNVFVPTFAPQYADMVNRGGIAGVSVEDRLRNGVWVPLSWLQEGQAKPAWKPFTAEQLREIYGRNQPTPEAP